MLRELRVELCNKTTNAQHNMDVVSVVSIIVNNKTTTTT